MHIIIYTKTGCPWCSTVLTFLKEQNIAFEEREVTAHPVFFAELVEKSGQQLTPTLDINGVILADSDVDQVSAFLKRKICE